jgi:hypothetical protein
MCYEIDYEIFAAQRKAQEARIKQERRAGVIDQLLNEANKQGDDTKTEGTPSKRSYLRNSRCANSPAPAGLLATQLFELMT